MNNAEPVDHFIPYGHLDFTVTFFDVKHFNSQPFAETVVLHHVVHHFLCQQFFFIVHKEHIIPL